MWLIAVVKKRFFGLSVWVGVGNQEDEGIICSTEKENVWVQKLLRVYASLVSSCIQILLLHNIIILCFYTVNSFCALASILLKNSNRYILSEVFCQDPIERYFSKQRHRGGGNENPTVDQFHSNSAILVQRQQVGSVLKSMNVEPNDSNINHADSASEPLPKRRRQH